MKSPYRSANDLVSEARSKYMRFSPQNAFVAMGRGALLVDTRYLQQRMRDGDVPDSMHVESNELLWRCDPNSQFRDQRVKVGSFLIIMCNQGFSSSLAAATLLDMELPIGGVTDVIGGFEAWKSAGLPSVPYVES